MSIERTELMRLMSGGPARAGAAPAGGAGAGATDFAAMLRRAREGELSSGREVTVARTARVDLTPEQLRAISAAADRAEAQGATRALVMIDGQTVRLNITDRQVTGAVDLKSPAVLTGIDAVISIPGEAGRAQPGGDPARVLPLPGRGIGSPSLLKALQEDRGGEEAA
jgi:hypothetical protein